MAKLLGDIDIVIPTSAAIRPGSFGSGAKERLRIFFDKDVFVLTSEYLVSDDTMTKEMWRPQGTIIFEPSSLGKLAKIFSRLSKMIPLK